MPSANRAMEGSAIKLVRGIWVSLTNGAVVYLLYSESSSLALMNVLLENGSQNKQVWFKFCLRALIPTTGILLEVFGQRFAKWVNTGFFLIVGVLLTVAGILAQPDEHATIALFLGLISLAVACVDWFMYFRISRAYPDAVRQ